MNPRTTLVLAGILALAGTEAGCIHRRDIRHVPPAPANTTRVPPPAGDAPLEENPAVLEQQRKSYTPPD